MFFKVSLNQLTILVYYYIYYNIYNNKIIISLNSTYNFSITTAVANSSLFILHSSFFTLHSSLFTLKTFLS
jgi:hypothetical protein